MPRTNLKIAKRYKEHNIIHTILLISGFTFVILTLSNVLWAISLTDISLPFLIPALYTGILATLAFTAVFIVQRKIKKP